MLTSVKKCLKLLTKFIKGYPNVEKCKLLLIPKINKISKMLTYVDKC